MGTVRTSSWSHISSTGHPSMNDTNYWAPEIIGIGKENCPCCNRLITQWIEVDTSNNEITDTWFSQHNVADGAGRTMGICPGCSPNYQIAVPEDVKAAFTLAK